VLGLGSLLSISYYPDVIHLAFIAPVFFIAATVGLEWLLAAAERAAAAVRPLAQVLTALVVIGLGAYLWRATVRARAEFPIAHDTAFGRVDFATKWEPILIDTVRDLLARTPSHELFCYPNIASPYLTTGGRNPTPYHHLLASFSPPQHVANAIAILQERAVPYVIAQPLFVAAPDPVITFIGTHYDLLSNPKLVALGELPLLWVYRHKSLSAEAVVEPR
jgi:hypothetical protein